MYDDILKIQQVISRFANSFDLKDWGGLEACFSEAPFRAADFHELRQGFSPPIPQCGHNPAESPRWKMCKDWKFEL